MMPSSNGHALTVPPGFRFHPTDEELLHYYLRKKVSYEAIDLDVIREIDLNKLEPWDLKEKCKIGSGHQNDWYFFSHKDKKYPTGTRTNRATTAGFWKATGRDKPIHLTNNSKRIGMRKTLVFYTGRAPHGLKTDWIMHEYRLDDETAHPHTHLALQENGWVVCRVFKKKNYNRVFQQDVSGTDTSSSVSRLQETKQSHTIHGQHGYAFDGMSNMHLPQLFCPESTLVAVSSALASPMNLNTMSMGIGDSQNCGLMQQTMRFNGDFSFLDKLLASHDDHHHGQLDHHSSQLSKRIPSHQVLDMPSTSSTQKFLFQYLGNETDILKFPK